MLVGLRKTSPKEMVGKGSGRAPAANTPLYTASTSSGTVRWQLLNPDGVVAIPIIGFFRTSLLNPIDRAKDERS